MAIFDFFSGKFVTGYPCVRPSILFYIHGPAILYFFELLKYHKITQIQNSLRHMYSTFPCKFHVWRFVRCTIVPCTPLFDIN